MCIPTLFNKRRNALHPDMCKCATCGTAFKVEDCEMDHGCELPEYTDILCAVCDDGGHINNFWFSKEKQ